MPFATFDRSQLKINPLGERVHDMGLPEIFDLGDETPYFDHPDLAVVADRVAAAHRQGGQVILMMGAHMLKLGLSRFIIDLMERGVITHVAMNGAGPIHDFELALIGGSTESVARYIQAGQFGLWAETGRINEAIVAGAQDGIEVSVLAAGYRLGIPVTVHVGIGYDIVHEHPNCDGAALGQTSYHDFLIIAQTVSKLQGGVLLNFGTAVMGPEVYLKALAMARNVAHQRGEKINKFTTAVFDLINLGDADIHTEASKDDPRYYYRPYKTILVRTVQDGGESFYFRGDHRATFPVLHRAVLEKLTA
jgi:hypothetical protein